MTAVLVAQVREYGGEAAVEELLRRARSRRSEEYLRDIVNWISYDEAVALWRIGAGITHNPQFARTLGEVAARHLNASPVAALLRSLGSPEAVYRQIATTSQKYSVVTKLEATSVRPGHAEIVAVPVEGFPRDPDHCAWTVGLLTQPPVLFGLAAATVEHDECSVYGASACVYRVQWDTGERPAGPGSEEQIRALRGQVDAMRERLQSVFATATDLIATDDIAEVLARITDRAAVEVRATRYLLAVTLGAGAELHCHQKGFEEQDVPAYAERILHHDPGQLPGSWLVVPIRSNRHDYGRLLAMFDGDAGFLPQERELLEVYSRYAASALDSASALSEAKQRYAQSSALLELARALARAGTSDEIAARLSEAVPAVVDCDRVGVYLWDPARGELVTAAVNRLAGTEENVESKRTPTPGGPLEKMLAAPSSEPMFIDADTGDPLLRELLERVGAVASILVPLASTDALLGVLIASVIDGPERLAPTNDLLDRLSGVAAQATTALQNGRLVDQMTHRALHDQLTGLPNRSLFAEDLRAAVSVAAQRSKPVTLFYIDLDGFKPVNDRFGHDIGDLLLQAVGKRLSASTRARDVVARLGGDEFAVLMVSPASPNDADAVAARLRAAFEQPFKVEELTLRLGASVGRAIFPLDSDSAEGLLRRADAAMFEAKRNRSQLRAS